ncbi:unnamed protein product [marine sediment metagenome]|uniref:Uncharacterized protein n=1 Tax=marine sediment metagenome TaxID=412755 RepID=X1C562_9ZZZZ
MSNGIPESIRELYFFCKEKFENLEQKFITLQTNPDNFGKWVMRVLIGINSIAVILYIFYKVYKGI